MPSPEEQAYVSALLRPLRSPCVVELGAHCGEDEVWIRGAFQEPAHYIMVEPDPRNCQKIVDAGPLTATRRLIVGAVSDVSDFQTFHFSHNVKTGFRTSGSLRKPTGHLEHFPDIHFVYTGKVQTFTLDEIFEREWLTKIDLLWVDIQGAENLMIKGGPVALSHTRYLFMEIEKVELYEGEGLRDDLVSMLPGWQVLNEFEFNICMVNTAFQERGPR